MPIIIKRILRSLGWMLLISGVLIAPFGCVRGAGELTTWVGGESADGVVTSIEKSQRSGPPGRSSYGERSVITFRTSGGKVVSFTHPLGGTSAPYSMQEHVKVVYDRDAPQNAVVPSALAMLILMRLLVVLAGGLLVLAGAGLLVLGALPWQSRSWKGKKGKENNIA